MATGRRKAVSTKQHRTTIARERLSSQLNSEPDSTRISTNNELEISDDFENRQITTSFDFQQEELSNPLAFDDLENDGTTTQYLSLAEYKDNRREEVQQYIENMTKRRLVCGDMSLPKETKRLPDMTNEEKVLFRWVNTELQKEAAVLRIRNWKRESLSAYTAKCTLYLSYHANKGMTPQTFVIDGRHLIEFLDFHLKGKDNTASRENIEGFRSALKFLHNVLGQEKLEAITDPVEHSQFEKYLMSYPGDRKVGEYKNQRAKEVRQHAVKTFQNKLSRKFFNNRYTHRELRLMMLNMVKMANHGSIKTKTIWDLINARLDMQMGHSLLLRGENRRSLEIADSMYIDVRSSRGKNKLLIFRIDHGKTQEDGEEKYVGACRNRNVQGCLVNAYAFSLWHRFDFPDGMNSETMQNFPKFLMKSDWYKHKVLYSHHPGSKEGKPISYDTQKNLDKMCMDTVGLKTYSVTHVTRKASAGIAESEGVPVHSIKFAGKWANSTYEKIYGAENAFDYIHFIGGFVKDEAYHIGRDVEPEEELKRQIFPWLEREIQRVKERNATYTEKTTWDDRDDQVLYFLDLLKNFRRIILQDLAVWMEIAPNSIFCNHEVTKHTLFKPFMKRVLKNHKKNSLFPESREASKVIDMLIPPIRLSFGLIKLALDGSVNIMATGLAKLMAKIERAAAEATEAITQKLELCTERVMQAQAQDNRRLYSILEETLRAQIESSALTQRQIRALEDKIEELSLGPRHSVSEQTRSISMIDSDDNSDSDASPNIGASLNSDDLIENDHPEQWAPIQLEYLNRMPSTPTTEDLLFEVPKNQAVKEFLKSWYELSGTSHSWAAREMKWKAQWRPSLSLFFNKRKSIIILIGDLANLYKDSDFTCYQLGMYVVRYCTKHDISPNKLSMELQGGKERKKAVMKGICRLIARNEARSPAFDTLSDIS